MHACTQLEPDSDKHGGLLVASVLRAHGYASLANDCLLLLLLRIII